MSHRSIELLSPAGSMDKLRVAFRYGADAVYVGGKTFNLRAKSSNFSNDELEAAVVYAHGLGKKIFVALNILAHDREIKALPPFIRHLNQLGVDAVIVADLGVLDLVLEHSDIPVHISTQASSTNWRSVRTYQRLGAKRVILAREVSIAEMKKIKDAVPDMELEVFVHGSMCMTYSGRCNLSSYFSERDGNRGACTNSCRWDWPHFFIGAHWVGAIIPGIQKTKDGDEDEALEEDSSFKDLQKMYRKAASETTLSVFQIYLGLSF